MINISTIHQSSDELIVNATDVDCIVLPMKITELLSVFPSWQMACMVGLRDVICCLLNTM